jgi:NIMA (never in mitosis gene a)-related kinase
MQSNKAETTGGVSSQGGSLIEQYEKLEDIGKGSFGKVCKIKRKADGKIMVWKELDFGAMGQKEKQQLVSEVNILKELNHPHIVRYYDRIIDKQNTKIYIIMEYCERGDLGQIIRTCRKGQSYVGEDVIWKILTQITLGLHHCHRRNELAKMTA